METYYNGMWVAVERGTGVVVALANTLAELKVKIEELNE